MLFIILNFTDYKIIGELQTLTTVVERSQTIVETQNLEIQSYIKIGENEKYIYKIKIKITLAILKLTYLKL